MSRSRVEWVVAGLFGLTALAGVALLAVYVLGGQPQVEGILLGIALGSLGVGVVVWAQDLMDTPIVVEERHPATSTAAETADFQAALTEEAGFSRRRLLACSRTALGVGGQKRGVTKATFEHSCFLEKEERQAWPLSLTPDQLSMDVSSTTPSSSKRTEIT